MKELTKDEFEKGYAERSRTTVEQLYSMGRCGVLCDCNEEECHGWQMASQLDATTIEIVGKIDRLLPDNGDAIKAQLRDQYKLPDIIKALWAFRSYELFDLKFSDRWRVELN